MRITFCGAAGTVTGSCYMLEAAGHRILIDCGMFQGRREIRARNRNPFIFDPGGIEAVLLTHAHIDHSGLLPRLVKEGFRGPIYTTPATIDLCGIMLPDSAHIQEMEAEWHGRKASRAGRKAEEPLYTLDDAGRTLSFFKPIRYGEESELFPGLRARFLDAGHILGSAMIELTETKGGREEKIVFSGDLGQRNAPIIRDPTIIEGTDYLVIESTYGNRLHEDVTTRRADLGRVIGEAAKSGGNLIIPSFAVERTQDLLYEIKELVVSGMPEPRVYIDSPMAVSVTEIFRRHRECFDKDTWELISQGESPFDFPNLQMVRSVEESRALNLLKGGAVIISASGMCDAGRVLHHLKHNLWRPEAHLLFVGYQAEGTLGRRLLEGDKRVRILGEEIAVKAKIHDISGFSAHADRNGLLEWLSSIRRRPQLTFLVHGEDEVLAEWEETVRKETGLHAVVPRLGDTYDLPEAVPGATAEAAPTREDWEDLLEEADHAYRGFREQLPNRAPADPTIASRLRRTIRRIIEEMAKAG